LLQFMNDEAYEGYLGLISGQSQGVKSGYSLVFTGLHGAGT